MKEHIYFYFICKNCNDIGYVRGDQYIEKTILYCKECRKNFKIANIISDQGQRFGLYYENYDDYEIANILELEESTIIDWRNRNKLPKIYEKEDKRINSSLIYGLLNLGLNDNEIGKIIGKNRSTIAIWRERRELKSNNHKKIFINKICEHCNTNYKTLDKKSVFCCRDCNYEYIKHNPFRLGKLGLRGKDNPNWIKDRTKLKTPEKERLRKSIEFKKWREKIFERDNYSCQLCHDRGKRGHQVILHPHHIKSFARNPIDRFKISNGITLCKSCHVWVHNLNPLNFQ